MNRKILTFLLLISSALTINAQTINGIVKAQKSDGEVEPLAFASIYWLEGKISLESNEKGEFSFNKKGSGTVSLIATYVGYTKDTLLLKNGEVKAELLLKEQNELNAARVVGKQEGNFLSKITPVKTEVITAAGLCKMACCNLAESFENSASVTVGYADAITGARQIRLLGLSGIYTQMLDENRPVMRGIAAPFGLSYIPGQWLESIQIAKGPSSVVNGLEAITGQINLEHRKPTAEQPLFLNLFLSNTLRTEANVASSLQLNNKLSTVMLGHFSTDPKGHDGNHDGFKDEPVSMQFNVSNRWLYLADNGMQIRFGFKALSDDRVAGMNEFEKGMDITPNLWGSEIKNTGLNSFLKVGIPLNASNSKNIATVIDYSWHRLNSFFGLNKFDAIQNSAFVNVIFQNEINENHKLILGLSGQMDNLDETLTIREFTSADNLSDVSVLYPGREERSVGAYGEYTYTKGEKVSVVTGIRLDRNNIYGWLFAPRVNVKYAFFDELIFRGSAGRGFRSPNQISDNLGILSTGRKIVLENNPDIEDAWTYGVNLTGYMPFGFDKKASLSFDYFRTDFNSQLIVDQERNTSEVWFYNLDGRSYTNTYQADFSVAPVERFTILATFRYNDAKATLEGQGLVERPLVSRYKGVLNFQYATRMNKWTFDFTAQLNGPSKLPSFIGGGNSPVYPMFYAQVTKKFRDLDVYIGGENLSNYRQKHPIMNASDPYSQGFNSTLIWGPLMGVKVYAGLRFTIWK
ncbi:MAG TPA: TonB-dependent receptor [Bacteroidales bacterium]|nr:TonB-dependent receptor [Bacteroidales bacterium]